MILDSSTLWTSFATRHQLSDEQLAQFKAYYTLLREYNAVMNLTTIINLESVISLHFNDSLALSYAFDTLTFSHLADVGTGAGFPGIPLKIAYPQSTVYLIEVTLKKIEFLQTVINKLNLTNIEVIPVDWRTFLRTTRYPIDIFCARASLSPTELIRMFRPSCFYKTKLLVYWASKNWYPTAQEAPYIIKQVNYFPDTTVERTLVVFANTSYQQENFL